MGWRLPSYVIAARCCRMACYFSSPESPCWGKVDIVAEEYDESLCDYYWIHACEGHSSLGQGGGEYFRSPYPEDQGVPPVEDDE